MTFGDKKLIQMELRIRRVALKDTYTIGKLEKKVEGGYERICDVLEDAVRDGEKIYGQTAIPYGRYEIDMSSISPAFKKREWAKKYKGIVPLLKDVPNFSGVRVHPANSAEELQGCLATGLNTSVGRVTSSTAMYYHLKSISFLIWLILPYAIACVRL